MTQYLFEYIQISIFIKQSNKIKCHFTVWMFIRGALGDVCDNKMYIQKKLRKSGFPICLILGGISD